MDFGFTAEQDLLRTTIRDFTRKEFPRERIRELDEAGEFPCDFLVKMGRLGWTGLPFASRYGGSDGDAVDIAIVMEELGRCTTAAASVYNRSVIFGARAIYLSGTEEQKQYFIPRVCRGEVLFALGLTEPDAGSDAAAISTTARLDGDRYVLNGAKIFTTGAGEADYILFAVRTDPQAPKTKGISTILVARDTPGLSFRRVRTLGVHMTPTYAVTLQDVVVPRSNLVGEANRGWQNLMATLELSRMALAAAVVGAAQTALDDAVEYAKQRVQFGQPISKFQAISHLLVDLQVQVDAARLLTYRSAWLLKQSPSALKEASMAKLYATETYLKVASESMRVFGGYGFTMDFDAQRHLRDSRLYVIGDGASQIQREIIARRMGL